MGSKKQRAKQVKQATTSQPMPSRPRVVVAAHGSSKTTPRCYCAACEAPPSKRSQGVEQSPFLRLPREVRDQIYEELLVARLSKEDEKLYEKSPLYKDGPGVEHIRENAVDYFQQGVAIMPGSDRKYPMIVQAMGLLQANKQIHAEANSVLFSKNLFLVMVEHERVHTFWRCDNNLCQEDVPCFIMFHNLVQIKHLYIIVTNARRFEDAMFHKESATTTTNLKRVVSCFKYAGNKFDTLKVRYTSCFGGEIESVRDALDGDHPPGRTIIVKDTYGVNRVTKLAEASTELFKHCNTVLAPLSQLKAVAEHVQVRGDLPTPQITELTRTLSVTEPAPITKKKFAQERAAKAARSSGKKPSSRDFFKEIAEKYAGSNPGMADLARKMVNRPVYSSAIQRELFGPPTEAELARFRQGPPRAAAGESDESDDDVEQGSAPASPASETALVGVGSGGIGVLDGKVVLGPPRPPHIAT